jgi:hypothetical protein
VNKAYPMFRVSLSLFVVMLTALAAPADLTSEELVKLNDKDLIAKK